MTFFGALLSVDNIAVVGVGAAGDVTVVQSNYQRYHHRDLVPVASPAAARRISTAVLRPSRPWQTTTTTPAAVVGS
jgi:hypothetical protein